ncbi:MAG: S41 family peptidase, partial [Owenweeksia sp.]
VVAGLLIGMFLNFPTRKFGMAGTDQGQRQQKIRQIIDYIDFEYVDDVNTDSLLDITITDLLRRLDPHSTYIPLDEVAANEESIRGSFEGIGVEFRIFRDTLTVVNVIKGGPSDKAGLKAGNRILFADGEALFGETVNNQKVINTLKGAAGSRVKLDIYAPQTGKSFSKTVKRGEVPLKSVQASFMVDDKTGYIRLMRFSETSDQELKGALKKMLAQGADRLLLDLRDNPGGLLGAARDIADQFLTKDDMIVFTRDRENKKSEIYATGKGLFEKGKLVVLINEGSASASEIVAGAIQDNDRGILVGRRSFGKGLVQEEIRLNDGSRMRLTTQRYYTPTGRSIQKPYGDYDQGFLKRNGYNKDLPTQDSSSVARNEFSTPAGRKVYGGGGITPDVEVPFDTSRTAALIYHVSLMTNLDDKAFMYVDQNRSRLEKISRKEFNKSFVVNDTILEFFFGSKMSSTEKLDEQTQKVLITRIKATIASNLYGNASYIEVYFGEDPMIKEALRQLDKDYSWQP